MFGFLNRGTLVPCHEKFGLRDFFMQGGAFSTYNTDLALELCLLNQLDAIEV